MKKTFTLLAFALTSLALIKFSNLTSRPAATPDGGYTGAPTTNRTCATSGCHSGSPIADPSKLVVKMAVASGDLANSVLTSSSTFVPGTTYWMSLELPAATGSRFGFSLTALTGSNAQAGSFTITNSTATTLVNTSKDISHKNANGTTKAWIWKWNAPSSTTPVSFYYVGMYANGNGNESGDAVYNASTTISAAPTSVIDEKGSVANVAMYPTQTMNDFAMEIVAKENANATVELISLSGLTVTELFNGKISEGSNSFRFNIADVAAGNYLVSVVSEGKRITKPLVKL